MPSHEKGHLKLHDEVKGLLERRHYQTDLPLLQEMISSYNFNDGSVGKKVSRYKVLGLILLLAIPIISTIISFAVNLTDASHAVPPLAWMKVCVPVLSLALTLLTVLNSVLKPSVRFARSCRIGVELFHWRCGFLEALETVDLSDDKKLMECLSDHRKSLRRIQEAQINLALPDQA